jgi:hypothetical protein
VFVILFDRAGRGGNEMIIRHNDGRNISTSKGPGQAPRLTNCWI